MHLQTSTRWPRPALLLTLLTLLAGACGKSSNPTPPPTPPAPPAYTGPSQVAVWLTTIDKAALFQRQKVSLQFTTAATSDPTIVVDTTQAYQTMDGFGYTLTGGSAQVMSQMSAPARAALIKELFATDSTAIGISYLRVSIGASDLNEQPYTYDDSATPDPTLAKFSLAPDEAYFIPVLKEILAVNPTIKILGSPWTAPPWMKQGANAGNPYVGGSLRPEYYPVYAQYFVKYLQGMQAAGITLDAVTLQNEPLYDGNNPSMYMAATDQAEFIKNHVGPALRGAGLATKIITYDHNCDGYAYALTVLGDPSASLYVDGSAYHLYNGTINQLSLVHNAFPNKNVYFTEQWTQAPGNLAGDLPWHVEHLEVGAPRNWSRNVLEWNLASNASYGPHTSGNGCSQCLGAVTISGDNVARNPAYYAVAHSSKFVRPGSVRVASNEPAGLSNVAYKTPGGKRVLVVLNTKEAPQKFNIQFRGKVVGVSLPGKAVATYIW